MTTSDERLVSARTKIERAKKHIRDLEREVRVFLDSQPYVLGTKRNPQTRQLTYYVVSVREPPTTIAAVIGDALQNLRSALDHLAYQLVLVGSGGTGSLPYVYFPIADNATKYEAGRLGKVKGMRPEAIQAIDATKPYKGGNSTLWQIHKLNNIDKHRLILTVGSAFQSVNIGHSMQRTMQRLHRETWPDDASIVPVLDLYIRPADRLFPLKAGNELFTDIVDAEVNEKMQFVFEVAFGEPQIIEGELLVETLQQMTDLVDNLILSFGPLLN